MPFRSPLLSLQRLRLSLERVAWLRLKTLHAQIAAASARLDGLQQEKKSILKATAGSLREGVQSEELRLDSVTALEFEEARVDKLLKKLVEQRQEAEREYMRCRREREMVENAIEGEREAYEEELRGREQAAVDDETLQRITREREVTRW